MQHVFHFVYACMGSGDGLSELSICSEYDSALRRGLFLTTLYILWSRADVVIKYPKFSSTGFIAFLRPPRAARRREFDVMLEFRPDLLDGLLLFAADDDVRVKATRGRFFAVTLVKARVHFRYIVLNAAAFLLLALGIVGLRRRDVTGHEWVRTALLRHCVLSMSLIIFGDAQPSLPTLPYLCTTD